MKSLVLRAGLLIAAAVSIPIACKRGGGDEILVGEYGSLTGTTATFGQSTNNAIQTNFLLLGIARLFPAARPASRRGG